MLLAKYLQEHEKKIGDFIGKIDYSQSQLDNMAIILYPNELLEQIGKTVKKPTSSVLFELLILEDPAKMTEVVAIEELATAVKKKQPYIYISEPGRTENSRLVNSVLSEKDTLGLELGSRGGVNVLGEIIYQLQKLFSSESEEFKTIKSKLRGYRVKTHDKNGTLIYKREETY